MDPELSWGPHIDAVIKRCFGILIGLIHIRHIIPLNILPRIVDALVPLSCTVLCVGLR